MNEIDRAAYNLCSDAIMNHALGFDPTPATLDPMGLEPVAERNEGKTALADRVSVLLGPHVGHLSAIQSMIDNHPPLLVVLGGPPGLGKTYHHTLRESGAEREVREELGHGLMGLGYNGMGVYDYMEDRFHPYDRFDYPVLADEKKLPEWQQRRNRSANAKQDLIDKLKARRNAR